MISETNVMNDKNFEIVIEKQEAFNSPETFVTGFSGLGAVGYIACKHFIDELHLERVGVLKSSAAPPFICLTDSGHLAMAFEFYSTPDYKTMFFFPRLPPYRHAESEFSELLSDWILHVFHRAILIGGVDKRLKEDKDSKDDIVRYIPTRQYLSDPTHADFVSKKLLSPGLFVQGPLAILLGNLDLHNFSALGVLAYAERERPDPEGAANAVRILNSLLQLSCPVEELLKNAALLQEELIKSSQIFPSKDETNPPETYT